MLYYKVGTIITPFIQMRKWRHGKVKEPSFKVEKSEGSCLKDQVNGSAISRTSNVRKEIIYSTLVTD